MTILSGEPVRPIRRLAATLLLTLALPCGAADAITHGKVQQPASSATVGLASGSGNACTATIVGPRAVITSASCAKAGANPFYVRTAAGRVVAVTCEVHPLAAYRQEADLALCQSSADLDGPVAKISLDTLPNFSPTKSWRALLYGEGCTVANAGSRSFGRPNYATADPKSITPVQQEIAWLQTNGGALCTGDTGAGVYIDGQPQSLIGVGARSDGILVSQIVLFYPPATADWIRGWSARHEDAVCGLAPTACVTPAIAATLGSTASASDAAVQALMPSGVDTAVQQVVKAGQNETRNELVSRVCGEVPASFLASLPAASGAALPPGSDVVLPPCPPPLGEQQIDDVTVTAENRGWDADHWCTFARQQNQGGWLYCAAPKDRPTADNFLGDFTHLNRERYKDFDPQSPSSSGAPKIRVPLGPRSPLASPKIRYSDSFRPVFVQPANDNDCVPDAQSDAMVPIDLEHIEPVIQRNIVGTSGINRSRVVVVDDGLDLNGNNNGPFAGDVVSNRNSNITPVIGPEKTSDWYHGTAVATVILGGPNFIRSHDAAQFLQLQIVQIYQSLLDSNGEPQVSTNPSRLTNSFKTAGVNVVNMSIEGQTEITDLSEYATHVDGPLIIVAAGNDTYRLPELQGQAWKFPAMQASADLHIIAVAAWNGQNKKIASFSNKGLPYVQIAAPGCDIPVMLPNDNGGWSERRMSGTSFAAPIVTFTAAMVEANWTFFDADGQQIQDIAREVKKRLLASADIVDTLAGDVQDGRLVNPVKALARREGVVEYSPHKLLFGKLGFRLAGTDLRPSDSIPFENCVSFENLLNPAPQSPKVKSILKMHPHYVTNFDTLKQQGLDMLVYAEPADGTPAIMARFLCKMPNNLEILLEESETSAPHSWPIGDVIDIVPPMHQPGTAQ